MKKRFFSKKIWLSIIACLLVCVMTFEDVPAFIMEAAYEPIYISDLCMFYDTDYNNAKAKCDSAGFTPIDYDFNKGNGDEFVVLGYRTTKERSEAITDVRTLYMGLGYETYDYSNILDQHKEQMEQIAREMLLCCKEFKANYEKGSPQALLAYEVFNYIQLDDIEGTPFLGDYLMSDDCMPIEKKEGETTTVQQDPPGVARIAHYLTHGTASFGTLLYSTMVSAVSDYNPDVVYKEGKYEIEVNVPETLPNFALPEEVEESLVSSLLAEANIETTETIEETVEETIGETIQEEPTEAFEETVPEEVIQETSVETTPEEVTEETSVETTSEEVIQETSVETTSEEVTEETSVETTPEEVIQETSVETTPEEIIQETSDETEPAPNEIVKLVLNCNKNYANWAERIHLTGAVKIYEEAEYINLFDAAYQNQALNIKTQIQDFAAKYQNASARYAVNGDAQLNADANSYDSEDIAELCQEVCSDIQNDINTEESKADAAYLTAYQILDKYQYNDKMTVAQYIIDVGTKAYTGYKELQALYPLIAAMTDGQVQMLQMNGLLPMVMALANDDTITENASSMLDLLDEEIQDYNGQDYISVYAGIEPNRDSEMIAVTDESKAMQIAGKQFEMLTEPSTFQKKTDTIMQGLQLVSQVSGALSALITVGGMFAGKMVTIGVCWNMCFAGGFWSAVCGLAGFVTFALPLVCGAVILLLSIIKSLVKLISKWIQGENIPWSDIPRLVFDYYDNAYVQYHVVPRYQDEDISTVKEYTGMICDLLKGKGDLNDGHGKRWCSLYYTKTAEVGSPLIVPEEGQPFMISNTDNKMLGYTPLCEFSTVVAADLNSYSKKSEAPNIFMFYKTEQDVNGHLNDGKDTDIGNSKYVSGLKIAYGDSESVAKTQLIEKGFTVYPQNLMGYVQKGIFSDDYEFCYIGYTTSKNPKDAITDIRVMPQETQTVHFGTAGYTSAGTMQSGDSLYYTSDTNMGEPITDNFKICNNPKDAPEGWEPVLTFGGFEYDFNNSNTKFFSPHFDSIENSNPSPQDYLNALRMRTDEGHVPKGNKNLVNTFLYYLPSKIYTAETEDGPATKYLGGLAIFECDNYDIDDDDYRYEAFCTYYASLHNEGRVHYYNLIGDYTQSMIITRTTYNPKRAVYGIRSYTGSPNGTSLLSSLGSRSAGSYAVCDVITANYRHNVSGKDIHHFSYSKDHAYSVIEFPEKYVESLKKANDFQYVLPEDFEKSGYWKAPYSKAESYVQWEKYSIRNVDKIRRKAIYLQGANDNSLPLTENDVIFTQSPLKKSETARTLNGNIVGTDDFHSVQDFKTPNADAPHDLALQLSGDIKYGRYSGSFYIYLRRTPVEKQYISAISVASYELYSYAKKAEISEDSLSADVCTQLNSNGDDICIMTLLSSCTDEIYPFDISTLNATEFHEDKSILRSVGDWFENIGYSIGGTVVGIGSESMENSLERKKMANQIKDNCRCWQDDLNKYLSNECSYIGFSRTDNEMDAIKGIIKYKPENGNAPSILKIDNVQYTRCGDAVHDYLEGDYYIYATKQTGASPGRAISAVSINTAPIVTDAATACTANANLTELKTDPNCMNFIHCFYNDENMYMDAIYLGRGKTSREALCDLLNMNCCNVIMYNLHSTKKDEYVYIGYSKYQPMIASDYTTKSGAIRDIRIVTETDPDASVQIDGILYKRAYDRFSYFGTNEDAIALNDTDRAYLYFTTVGAEAPIEAIGVAERDRVPPTENQIQVWENILTEHNIRYNINNSFITFTADDDDIVADNRLYLFAKRIDNSVKFGSEIVGGHCEEMMQYGNLNYVRG